MGTCKVQNKRVLFNPVREQGQLPTHAEFMYSKALQISLFAFTDHRIRQYVFNSIQNNLLQVSREPLHVLFEWGHLKYLHDAFLS